MDEKPPIVDVQPAAVESVIVVQQPTVVAVAQPLRQWSTGVFDCFADCGTCVFGLFCLQCLLCNVSSRMGEHCLAGCCGGAVGLRTKMRLNNGIEGGVLRDACVTGFCGPCMVCQLDRELKHVGV